jgi:DNA-directed RNA polymerase subunit beta'
MMVNQRLPKDLRNYDEPLVGDALELVLTAIAKDDPDKYREVSHALMDLGREAAYLEGTTLRMSDVVSPIDRQELFDFVQQKEDEIDDMDIPEKQKDELREEVYGKIQDLIEKQTYDQALKKGNLFALQVKSKARGNPTQLSALLSTPGAFRDGKGRILPIFVKNSYAEGLTPAEYFAASFGARRGVLSTKFATREAGDLGKQISTAAAGLIVTEDDCGTSQGYPADVADKDNVGALLLKDTGGFEAGTPVDPKTMETLRRKGYDEVLLRSPITCGAKHGVCKKCAGLQEDGNLPNIRDHIGVKAGSALSERIAQGSLNVKHGGQKQVGGEKVYGGFPVINQLNQVPKVFPHRASVAELEGTVEGIREAPQGGNYVTIAGQEHYVDPEQEVTVKTGDVVEAGDQLSTGILNPAEIVQYKGLGEGRKYFTERLTKAFQDSKLKVNRRNVEVVARAIVDQVDVDDPDGLGDYLPGDKISYSQMAYSYVPRDGAQVSTPKDQIGRYLEQPALHYTIGTRITKKVADKLAKHGVDKVVAHENEPGFTPRMERLRTLPARLTKDWMAQLQGSNLKATLMQNVQRGAVSERHGTNPVPSLAYGVEFGESKKDRVTF